MSWPQSSLDTIHLTRVRSTIILVRTQGVLITLRRPPAPTDDGAGGTLRPVPGSEVPLDPQLFYIGGKITNRINNFPFEELGAEGEYVKRSFTIIGMPAHGETPAVDIEENDIFQLVPGGRVFHVAQVDTDRSFQVKAEVHEWSS